MYGRYPVSGLGRITLGMGPASIIAPGEDGAIGTIRLELLRESLQESEARLFIEKALADDVRRAKLGDELARRCEEILKERSWEMWRISTHGGMDGYRGFVWPLSRRWEDRSAILYAAAAEVAGAPRE